MIKLCPTFILLILPLVSHAQIPVIKASSDKAFIQDGSGARKSSWSLNPRLNPDVYESVANGTKKITFYTDIDSISFNVKPGGNYDFIVLLNANDTCRTRIEVRKEVEAANFTSSYISKNKGNFSFEIPEVQELVHIIIALTDRGMSDSNMVNHESPYYKEVIRYFDKFRQEEIVAEFDKQVRGSYSRVKMDACGFYFEGETIKKDKTYDRLNWGPKNYISPYTKQLEEFSKKSGFREFYKSHKTYYDSLIVLLEKQVPIRKQWNWLEEKFPSRYDNYRITFSPLVKGSHSTNHFETPAFKQTVMFVAGPMEKSAFSEAVTEGLMSRTVFTEIDHNYVNPVSDKYPDAIDSAFAKRELWAKKGSSADSYSTAYLAFNEYMTWAVFTLYCLEHYDKKDFDIINERTTNFIVERRGFSNYKNFNEKLLALYQEKKPGSIASLYPEMLNWCMQQ
jgi:hypothetical protein